MSSDKGTESVLRCIFCGRSIHPNEIVRFRGAISCEECARREQREHPLRRNVLWFRLAVPGTVLAAIASIGLLKVTWLSLSSAFPGFGIPGFESATPYAVYGTFVALLGIGFTLVSPGFIGFYRNYDRPIGLLLAALCMINGAASVAFYLISRTVTLLTPIEEVMAALGPCLQSVIISFVLFGLIAGVYLPLTRDDHGSAGIAAAPGVLLLLSVSLTTLLGLLLEYVLLPLAMTLLAVYFITARTDVAPSAKIV